MFTLTGCFNLPTCGDAVSVIFDGNTNETFTLPDLRTTPRYTRMEMKRMKYQGKIPMGTTIYRYTRNPDDGIPQMPIRHWAPEAEPMAYVLISPYGDFLFHKAAMEKHPAGTSIDSFLKHDPFSIANMQNLSRYPPDDRVTSEKVNDYFEKQ